MMKEKKLKNFERNIIIAVVGLAILVVVLGICSFLQFTKPYAVSEDGVKVEEPWVVKIGNKETFVVASEKDGQDIIERVKNSYSTENTKSESTTLSPEITVEEKDLDRGDEILTITETDEAVAEVVAANKTESPVVTVTTVEQVEKTKAINYKTEYKKSDDLYEGQEKVVAKGKKGKRSIVSQVIKENGKTVSTEVLSSSVEEKPTNKVVEQGTKEAAVANVSGGAVNSSDKGTSASSGASQSTPSSTSENSSSDSSSNEDSSNDSSSGKSDSSSGKSDSGETKSGSGQAVVDYALKFVGNPYVYGGTSLTNGADCSGFTMRVYEKFGISLPHSSSAQRSYGKEVSYSNAKPGDLICYSGHVAIYIGNGKIVHASTPSTGIKVSSATYKNILTVRRFFD